MVFWQFILTEFTDGYKTFNPQFGFLAIGINHEQQHQELLMADIKNTLGTQKLMPAYGDAINEYWPCGTPGWIDLSEQVVTIGVNEA